MTEIHGATSVSGTITIIPVQTHSFFGYLWQHSRSKQSFAFIMADSILVLQDGNVMEYGRAKDVLENPQNAYTKKLLSAVPRLRRE